MQPKNSITLKAPLTISGSVTPVSSKSECNRALIIQALSKNTNEIGNLSGSDDTITLQQLLHKCGTDKTTELFTGDGGTVMRFLTVYCACTPGEYILTGSDRMKERPIGALVETLEQLGADVRFENRIGFPPLHIMGKELRGGKGKIKSGISSQFVSALLLCAPYFKNGLELELQGDVVSQPYIQMTIELMKQYGIEVKKSGNSLFVAPGRYASTSFTAESDWTAASYYYSLVALASHAEVELLGYKKTSLQGDQVVVSMFEKLGVITEFTNRGIILKKSDHPVPEKFEFDFTGCPDLAQTLAVCCAVLGIEAALHGLQTLRVKETDRIQALQNELKKIGITTTAINNSLLITSGKAHIPVEAIETYNDHRMAMSFAVLSARIGPFPILHPHVVSKSYPHFWNDLEKIGFSVI